MRTQLLLTGFAAMVLTFSGVGCRGEPRPSCGLAGPGSGEIGTVCGFRNPEDLDFDRNSNLVVVANMRHDGDTEGGFLSAMTPLGEQVRKIWPTGDPEDFLAETEDDAAKADGCPGRPNRGLFRPHGINFVTRDGETHLYVVAHASGDSGREAVEIFQLQGSGADARLRWTGCIPTPENTHGNDVVVAADGTVVVSNWMEVISLWNTIRGAVFHQRTGDLMSYAPAKGWSRLAGTDSAIPNGVAISRDGSMLFYAETGTGRIHRRPFDETAPSVFVEVGGNPDNLTWTDRGTLLVATHTGGPAFTWCEMGGLPCRASWEVHEIDPVTLATQLVLAHDGEAVGAIATAVQIGERIYLGSVFDDRLGYAAMRPRGS